MEQTLRLDCTSAQARCLGMCSNKRRPTITDRTSVDAGGLQYMTTGRITYVSFHVEPGLLVYDIERLDGLAQDGEERVHALELLPQDLECRLGKRMRDPRTGSQRGLVVRALPHEDPHDLGYRPDWMDGTHRAPERECKISSLCVCVGYRDE